ncbi:MAG TPA: type II secretion system protein [Pseudomonas sp.]|jgi:MSHA pilin protein MshC|nr:type II secretion system protein [Pseudomonas sp.]
MNTQRGFTLVELILVMVVIGILAAVVGPRFFSRDVFDERIYFEQALAAVRYAQKVAVASGCSIQAEVDDTGYRLTHVSKCGEKVEPGDVVNDPVGDRYEFGMLPVPPKMTVTFNALGATKGQKAITLPGGFGMTVHETGFIEVSP